MQLNNLPLETFELNLFLGDHLHIPLDVWHKTGQQHSDPDQAYAWSGDIDLSSYSGTIKIRFRGVDGDGYTGDMAIGDILVTGEATEATLGDFSGDNKVNLEDFSILAAYWLDQCGHPNWCEGADINQSNDVGLDDLIVMLQQWLTPQ